MTGRASKCSIASLAAAVLLATCAPSGQAQSFALAIGSGGHCRHHHCGGWSVGYGFGPWYGPAWYAPPPAVVYAAVSVAAPPAWAAPLIAPRVAPTLQPRAPPQA